MIQLPCENQNKKSNRVVKHKFESEVYWIVVALFAILLDLRFVICPSHKSRNTVFECYLLDYLINFDKIAFLGSTCFQFNAGLKLIQRWNVGLTSYQRHNDVVCLLYFLCFQFVWFENTDTLQIKGLNTKILKY